MTNLEKAHRINRILMRKLHSVCEEYGITYYYDSGSLIGAVRHKDFIPWDDDIDIAFTREEFKKLKEVPKEAWGEDFELVEVKDLVKDAFFDFPARLVYLGESVPLQVGDDYFNCPVDYDKVLRACYGDYMQLPPEETRVPMHVKPDEQ